MFILKLFLSSLLTVLEEQSMEEVQLPKSIAADEELRILRRRLQERFHPPPVTSVITKIIQKKPFSMECFRTLQDKESLLDESINSGSGDAILTVCIIT